MDRGRGPFLPDRYRRLTRDVNARRHLVVTTCTGDKRCFNKVDSFVHLPDMNPLDVLGAWNIQGLVGQIVPNGLEWFTRDRC